VSHGVQVAGAVRCATTRIMTGVGDLVQRTGDSHTGQVAPCAVCTVHVETSSASFLVEP
jgi:hypothetical protein